MKNLCLLRLDIQPLSWSLFSLFNILDELLMSLRSTCNSCFARKRIGFQEGCNK